MTRRRRTSARWPSRATCKATAATLQCERRWTRRKWRTSSARRFNTLLIGAFALAAVLLAILGIYSVIAFTVALRSQEMAIRMALGSQRSGIIGLVLSSGAKLAVIGCVLG